MNVSSLLRTAGLVAGVTLLVAGPAWAASDDLPAFADNYIKFSAGGIDVDGSKAASQARTQIPKVGVGGIEAFNFTREVNDATTMSIDGHALPGAENYLAQFKVVKTEVGQFDVGYKTFRTFYDGAGGFFPTNKAWLPIYPRALYVDRGEFRIGGTIERPNQPVFTFRYTHATRDGRKESTIMGDSDLTGIPIYSQSALNPVSANRKILPAYLDLDETLQTLEASVRHSFGNTTASLAVVGTRIDNLDTRSIDRYVGELRPYPAIPSNPLSLIPGSLGNNPNRGLDIQGVKEDAWNLTARVETVLNEKVTAYAGVSYRTSDADITGSRLITLTMNSAVGPISGIGGFTSGGRPPYSYTTVGTVELTSYTANAGVSLKPSTDLAVDLGVKAEDVDVIAHNTATYVSTFMTQATGVVATPQLNPAANWSRNKEKLWAPEAAFRYSGLRKLALYGSADFRNAPGDERHLDTHVGPGPSGSNYVLPAIGEKAQNVKENHLNAKLGGNWTPNQLIAVRGEFFTKNHENRFEGYGVSAGGLYVLDYDIRGFRATATVRPTATVSLSTRYVVQYSEAAVLTDVYAKGDSKDAERHSISETISWNPNSSVYLQGSVNFVYDTMGTAYEKVTGLAKDVIRNSDNNYWTGNLLVGFVVDKMTNAQLEATYYKADNFDGSFAPSSMPYGAASREYSVAAGITRKLSDRWVLGAKLGYFDSRNDTSGGNRNFKGPLAYLSVQHRL